MKVSITPNSHFGNPNADPAFPLGGLVKFRDSDDKRTFVIRGIFFSKRISKWNYEIEAISDDGFYSEAFENELQLIMEKVAA